MKVSTQNIFNEVKEMLKNKEIIFREDRYGGLIVIRGRRKNSGMEYYVNKGTIALLKLIKLGFTYNDVLLLMQREGVSSEEAEYIVRQHLEPLVLDVKEITGMKRLAYWHPPETSMPHLLGWEITWRCNLKCIYCFSSAGSILPPDYYEVTTEEAKKIIDGIEHKILFVWIGGGEPTLRSDLVEILRYLRKKDFFIQLSTNGILLDGKHELIKEIANLVDEVHIPLDGSRPEIHNKLRGGFNSVVNVIREFVKTESTLVSTGTVITKLNMDDVENIINLALDLGVHAWVWSPLFPCGRGFIHKDLMLEPKDMVKLHYILSEKARELEDRLLILSYTPGVTPMKMQKPTLRCGAVNYYLQLMPNGDVYPCSYFRWKKYKLGNLLNEDLEEILNKPIAKYFTVEIDKQLPKGKCRDCILFKKGYCNTGCKAMKAALGIDILDAFPYCTRDIPGSPLNKLYKKLVKNNGYKDK